jgi:WD40 repeat protein
MKAHLIQIVWHREHEGKFNAPIMSLDMHPHKLLLATAGQDKTVKVSIPPEAAACVCGVANIMPTTSCRCVWCVFRRSSCVRGLQVWQLVEHDGKWGATAICELDYHERSVNCVRWSPCGSKLASCGDGEIILWTGGFGPRQQRASHCGSVWVLNLLQRAPLDLR